MGSCQVADVALVAINVCPTVGAVAALTLTSVVALLRALVIPDLSPTATPVTLVMTPAEGVPRSGDTSVLFSSVAVAARSVALEVLSTFHNPTAVLSRA